MLNPNQVSIRETKDTGNMYPSESINARRATSEYIKQKKYRCLNLSKYKGNEYHRKCVTLRKYKH